MPCPLRFVLAGASAALALYFCLGGRSGTGAQDVEEDKAPRGKWAWLDTVLDFFTGKYLYLHLFKRQPQQQQQQRRHWQQHQHSAGKPTAAAAAVDVCCTSGGAAAASAAGQAAAHGGGVAGPREE
ncbi:hypothetical protein ABPG75_006997 [Micractinium tetrahymenae]